MSYDVRLKDSVTGETLNVKEPHHMMGGTGAMFGTTELWLNVTFNYGEIFRETAFQSEDGLYLLDGLNALDSIPVLTQAISNLKDDAVENYWDATEGNAKRALIQLLTFARMRPDGVWEITG